MSASANSEGFGPQFLMIPGPSPVADRVREAMSRQSVDFSGAAFVELADHVFQALKPVFGDAHQTFLYASNGHGVWEASLVNTLSPGDTVLLPETGLFSEAWRSMAKTLGLEVMTIPGDWRHGIDPDAVQQILSEDVQHRIKAVLVVHTDTAGSVTTSVERIRGAMDAQSHPALLMVDAIASLCTTPFEMTKWGVDVAVTASQKAMMVPPGLGICAVSEKALEAGRASTTPKFYWCWQERMKSEHYKRFCGTAPEQLVFALAESLAMLEEEGLENTVLRHKRLADRVRAAVFAWSAGGDLEFNAINPEDRANSVTTVRTPAGFDAERIRVALRDGHNVIVGGGLGELRGSIFRIGHMGYINTPYVMGALAAIDLELRGLGLSVGDGALEAALNA